MRSNALFFILGAALIALGGCNPTPPPANPPSSAAPPSEAPKTAAALPNASAPNASAPNVSAPPTGGASPGASLDAPGRSPSPTLPPATKAATGAMAETVTSDLNAAKKQIDETIAQQPKNHNMRMQAAEFYMKVGAYAEAVPHLVEATKISPEKPLAWIALGDAATFTGKFDVAAKAYQEAAKRDPDNPFVARGQGQMYLLQKKFNEARQTLEAGLKKYPQDAEIRTALGNLYLILNKPRNAIETLKPAAEKTTNRPDLHYMLADAYERDLHIETAIKHIAETVRLDPNNAEAWGRLGLYQINLTRYKEAREPLQRAIALRPEEPHFYWALGDSFLFDDKEPDHYARAKENYRKALQLNPNNDKALYSYGMALTRYGDNKDLEEAVGVFQRLIKVHPADMNAHYKLYETYRRLGRVQEAEAHKTKFKDLFAKGRTQTRDLYQKAAFKDTAEAHLQLGRQAMAAKNYPLAAKEFQLALERDRNLSAARTALLEAQKYLNQNPAPR